MDPRYYALVLENTMFSFLLFVYPSNWSQDQTLGRSTPATQAWRRAGIGGGSPQFGVLVHVIAGTALPWWMGTALGTYHWGHGLSRDDG